MGRTSQIVRIFASVARRVLLSVTFVWLASLAVVAENTDAGYSLKLRSIDADSIVLTLTNHTTAPVYLFDSYLNESDREIWQYFHRYNKEDDIVKLSFLPFQQFTILPVLYDKRMFVYGKGRYLRGNHQIGYHFIKIDAGDSLAISISKNSIISDRYYYDVNLKEYTFLEKTKDNEYDEKKVKEKKDLKLKRLKREPIFDDVTIELAVYRDIDLFLEYEIYKTLNYRYIGFGFSLEDLDEVSSGYDIVSCSLNLQDIAIPGD